MKIKKVKDEERGIETTYITIKKNIGSGSTLHYEDYDDALEEFNRRWLKEEYGE